jgi:hypothetical protein
MRIRLRPAAAAKVRETSIVAVPAAIEIPRSRSRRVPRS